METLGETSTAEVVVQLEDHETVKQKKAEVLRRQARYLCALKMTNRTGVVDMEYGVPDSIEDERYTIDEVLADIPQQVQQSLNDSTGAAGAHY